MKSILCIIMFGVINTMGEHQNNHEYSEYYKQPSKPFIPSPEACYDIKYNNPCTTLDLNKYGYHFPSCTDPCHFIQCSEYGRESFERPTACGTKWDKYIGGQVSCPNNDCSNICPSQKCTPPEVVYGYDTPKPTTTKTSYDKYGYNTPTPTKPRIIDYTPKVTKPYMPPPPIDNMCYDTKYNNPCLTLTDEQIKTGAFYFPSCTDKCHFIQCSEHKEAFDMPTACGTRWEQSLEPVGGQVACEDNDCSNICPNQRCESDTSTTKSPPVCYSIYNAPCETLTAEQIKNHEFYYPSCTDPCHFIQCSQYGEAFDMPTACGTRWEQSLPQVGGQVACPDNDCMNICPNQRCNKYGYTREY